MTKAVIHKDIISSLGDGFSDDVLKRLALENRFAF